MMDNVAHPLTNLSDSERLALTTFLERLRQEFSHTVLKAILYGSCVGGERGTNSDVDLLILSSHDDWREHEPIRFLAARLSNEHDVFLSVRIISQARLKQLRRSQPLLYKKIYRDGLELLRLGGRPESSTPQGTTVNKLPSPRPYTSEK